MAIKPNIPSQTAMVPVAPKSNAPTLRKPRALELMADRCNIEPQKLFSTLKETVFKGASEAELVALVVVANQFALNPFLRQIYAFRNRQGGGITPVVPIDGWVKLINQEPDYDGVMFEWQWKDEAQTKPHSCTCTLYHKKRAHPLVVTEYFDECVRSTDPWRDMPCRMLRHKALMQAARYAFGFAGIYDEDEAREIAVEPMPSEPPKPVFGGPQALPDPTPVATDPDPDPASTTQPEPPSDDPHKPATVEVPADADGAMLIAIISELRNAANVSDAQLTEWCRQTKLAKANQGWSDLAESKLRDIATKWPTLVDEIRTMGA
jgi:phage recombination protein Bet